MLQSVPRRSASHDVASLARCATNSRIPFQWICRLWMCDSGLGLTAKLAATLVTYPYLVVKTRAQSKVYNVKDYSCKYGNGVGKTTGMSMGAMTHSRLSSYHPNGSSLSCFA